MLEAHLERAAEAELSNEVQRLNGLHKQALDDIQSNDQHTEVNSCLLEETMESPWRRKIKGIRVAE